MGCGASTAAPSASGGDIVPAKVYAPSRQASLTEDKVGLHKVQPGGAGRLSRMNSLTEGSSHEGQVPSSQQGTRPGTPTPLPQDVIDAPIRGPLNNYMVRANSRGTVIPAGKRTSFSDDMEPTSSQEGSFRAREGPLLGSRNGSLTEIPLGATSPDDVRKRRLSVRDRRASRTSFCAEVIDETEEAPAPALSGAPSAL